MHIWWKLFQSFEKGRGPGNLYIEVCDETKPEPNATIPAVTIKPVITTLVIPVLSTAVTTDESDRKPTPFADWKIALIVVFTLLFFLLVGLAIYCWKVRGNYSVSG